MEEDRTAIVRKRSARLAEAPHTIFELAIVLGDYDYIVVDDSVDQLQWYP